MPKTVVQVPFDEDLLKSLNAVARSQRKPRAELIRQACRYYLEEKDREEKVRACIEGYRRIPETTDMAEAQESMLKDVWPKETW